MMQTEDLSGFLDAFASAPVDDQHGNAEARELLAYDFTNKDGVFGSEIWQLARSLRIAYVLGDAPREAAEAADTISRNVADGYCTPIKDDAAWRAAITWARRQSPAVPINNGPESVYAREREVGRACKRLREMQYAVDINAFGPVISSKTRSDIYFKVENKVKSLGGFGIMRMLFEFINKNKGIHDGMVLFGNRIPGLWDRGSPAVPMGWLMSLALKHMGSELSASDPNTTWHELVELIVVASVTFDCQRYGTYEDLNLHPTQFGRVLAESLSWREVFSVQQVPYMVFNEIVAALQQAMNADDWIKFALNGENFFSEARLLIDTCASNDIGTLAAWEAEAFMPTLYALATGEVGKVNSSYRGPFIGPAPNHDAFVFIRRSASMLAVLPKSMTAAALCNVIYSRIWKNLGSERAKKLVGESLEIAIGRACHGKADTVLSQEMYWVGKNHFDFDAATREGDRIVLIEAKSKSLTAKARAGDVMLFFEDFTQSFLKAMKQLARHEAHLRAGQTPLTHEGELTDDLRPLKIAVSFLSYGPVTDKQLLRALLISVSGSRFTPVKNSGEHKRIISEFNEAAADALRTIEPWAPIREGQPDLLRYLHDVFWLDLGQLLYILRRSTSVSDAFRPIRGIAFGSRDFWTELSFVDSWAVQEGKWSPLQPAA